MEELIAAREAYLELFKNDGPWIFGVPDTTMVRILRDHVKRGHPIPDDFNWYPDLDENSVA